MPTLPIFASITHSGEGIPPPVITFKLERKEEKYMSIFRLAVMFLVIGLLAGILGFVGIGTTAILFAKVAILVWLLKLFFFLFLLLAAAFFARHFFAGRNP